MPLKNGRTTAALQAIVVGNTIPAGVIQAFGGGTVPTGWLLCDGSVVSRTTYAGLFAAISDKNGNGDGSTTFHLPDLRGRFVRGADDMGTGAASRDPGGRTTSNAGGATSGVGSVQDDAMQGHFHNIYGTANQGVNVGNADNMRNFNTNFGAGAREPVSNGVHGTPRITSETRSKNAAASYIIKV
jgi:microcystin-dependent protein